MLPRLVSIDKRSQIKGGSRPSGLEMICTAWSLPILWKTLYFIVREDLS